MDYILAATSGVICGVIDIFLVGKPGESPVGNITDKWYEDRTKVFANPALLGLFFSILDQFNNTTHFVTGGELIALEDADGKFELRGKNVPSFRQVWCIRQ